MKMLNFYVQFLLYRKQNKITLIVSTERYNPIAGDILTLEYECVDVSENLYKIKKRQEIEEIEQSEREKEKLRESTDGL